MKRVFKIKRKTPEERFWSKVIKFKDSDCWGWTGSTITYGYGELRVDGSNIKAHRFSYIMHKGPIPIGKHILHTCDNPPCTNPKHLWVGTHKDNMKDMYQKNRNSQGLKHRIVSGVPKKSGLPRGVTTDKKHFQASAWLNGKRKYLGSFNTPKQAAQAYQEFINNETNTQDF